MRSALICVFLWLTVHKHRIIAASDEFYPTPIPLSEWQPEPSYDRSIRDTRQHSTNTALPPAVADVPAHYWEDALRHSVYLTLVRDKIDQLIAQDISHDKKPQYQSNDVNDNDLWDKIKSAPFDRIEYEESPNPEDGTIMSKGRLMEMKRGYRFAEDDVNKQLCNDSNCMDGVKALWSVKRERQRDAVTSSGRYHYELTFSVITQALKRQRKPHENPARTFTVREMTPEMIVDEPHEHKLVNDMHIQKVRPGRALWVHKNIVPHRHARYYHHGNDRLFMSLFADDDYEAHRRPTMSYPPPQYTQYSKVGYVGSPSDNQHHKKYMPYTYKQTLHQQVKYSRPPAPFPIPQPIHHYLDTDAIGVVSAPYIPPPSETRYHMPMKIVKTTRPPVLPTPIHALPSTKNSTFLPTVLPPKANATNLTTPNEMNFAHNKPKPTSLKISYFTDTLRPPVYNAPPGVFVTMDKKPFKPMPPLKLHYHNKPIKSSKPLDFRPSPQLLDAQFSKPDATFDGAFRPITFNYPMNNKTEESESKVAESSTTEEQITTKENSTEDKTKRTNKKSQRITTTTTVTPSITSDSSNNDFEISWGNLLGAFVKTTPMVPQPEKYTSTLNTTITTATSSITTETPDTTEEVHLITTAPTTTSKRTRPPPKFKNKLKPLANKTRKHKRVTSTTQKPSAIEEETVKKNVNDLMPQASSAASTGTRATPRWVSSSTTTTTTSKPTTTTTNVFTTFESKTTAETQTKPTKNKNRYRQSTLMQKGTSVKHDKWSNNNNIEKGAATKTIIPPTGHFPPRRLESKFQGYTAPKSSTQATYFDETDDDDYDFDLTTTTEQQKIKSITETTTYGILESSNKEETDIPHDSYEPLTSKDVYYDDNSDDYSDNKPKIYSSFAFYPKSTTPISPKQNEGLNDALTSQTSSESATITLKPKKKCKKKTTPTQAIAVETTSEIATLPTSTTTVETTTPDIFEELFGSLTSDEEDEKKSNSTLKDSDVDNVPAESKDEFIKTKDYLGFLSLPNYKSIEKKYIENVDDDEQYEDDLNDDDDFDDDEESYIGNESTESKYEETRESRNIGEADHPKPYSIFELMAME